MDSVQQVFAQDGVTATYLSSRSQFARHTHDAFGIGAIERGAQKSWSGRGHVEAGPGDVITVNPGEVHDGAPLGAARRRWRMLYFEPQIINALARDLTQERAATLEFAAPVFAGNAPARRLFLALFRNLEDGRSIHDMACEETLLRLLPLIGAKAMRSYVPDAPVHKAKQRIDDHPERRTSLGELARLSGTSKFQFLRAFTRASGLTPHAYIVQKRLQRAKRLIEDGEPIVAAAAICGFADQSHLTRTFVRSYGYTPGRLSRS